jgi:hypothetical protein
MHARKSVYGVFCCARIGRDIFRPRSAREDFLPARIPSYLLCDNASLALSSKEWSEPMAYRPTRQPPIFHALEEKKRVLLIRLADELTRADATTQPAIRGFLRKGSARHRLALHIEGATRTYWWWTRELGVTAKLHLR